MELRLSELRVPGFVESIFPQNSANSFERQRHYYEEYHMNYELRRERLRTLLKREGLSALLVTDAANRFYLSGFELHDTQCNESSGFLLITANGNDWLATDSRYQEAAAQLWPDDHIFIYKSQPIEESRALLKKIAGPGPLGFEAAAMSVEYHSKISAGLNMKPVYGEHGLPGLVEELRLIKDEAELSALERSMALNHALMNWLPGTLQPGQSEGSIAWRIECFFREHGASENSFTPIVAKNANAALPHYQPQRVNNVVGDILTENCHLLVDVGARLDNYCSDQTRTFWVGDQPDPKFLTTLELVQQAQALAIAALRPGITGREVFLIAQNFFAKHHVDHLFTHSLGHGLGLETHEAPRLSARSTTVLQPGMVVTIEPGLYYPSWGGARWEHVGLITEDGCRLL